jgi:hypothetical protein
MRGQIKRERHQARPVIYLSNTHTHTHTWIWCIIIHRFCWLDPTHARRIYTKEEKRFVLAMKRSKLLQSSLSIKVDYISPNGREQQRVLFLSLIEIIIIFFFSMLALKKSFQVEYWRWMWPPVVVFNWFRTWLWLSSFTANLLVVAS